MRMILSGGVKAKNVDDPVAAIHQDLDTITAILFADQYECNRTCAKSGDSSTPRPPLPWLQVMASIKPNNHLNVLVDCFSAEILCYCISCCPLDSYATYICWTFTKLRFILSTTRKKKMIFSVTYYLEMTLSRYIDMKI